MDCTHVTCATGHPPCDPHIGGDQKRGAAPDQASVSTTTTIDGALFVVDVVPHGVRTVHLIPVPVQLSFNTAQDALRSPSRPAMQGSVLGKRSQSSSDSPSCPRDLPTPEVTPTAKRIKTTSTSTESNPDGNKENIPPLPESPSPRRLRRTATENHTSPRNPRSKLATRV